MAAQMSLLQRFCALLLLFTTAAQALKFDLAAHSGGESTKKERCIRNFVAKDTLVVVTAVVGGYKGDGMAVNIHVRWVAPAGLGGSIVLTHGV
jgi:hypothetical protein